MGRTIIFRDNFRQIGKDPLDELAIKIRNIAIQSLKDYAQEISERMYDCYKTAIDWFYADYTPKGYYTTIYYKGGESKRILKHNKRKKRLYYAVPNHPANIKKYKNAVFKSSKSGDRIKISMEVNPKYIIGSPKGGYGKKGTNRQLTNWVFWRSYAEIIHGFTGEENINWQYIDGTQYQHINRYGKPSKWEKKSVVPNSSSGRWFVHKLAGTKNTTKKRNLDWMVKEGISNLRRELLGNKRYEQIFDKNMYNANIYI